MFIAESRGGLIPDLAPDPKGLLATAELRETWGGWDKRLNLGWLTSKESGVYDLSYLSEALHARSQ
jgi:hypothetical protein